MARTTWSPLWIPADGQGLVEYGIILAGIATVTIVALVFFGDPIAHVLDFISRLVEGAG